MELDFHASLCLLMIIGATFGDVTGITKISCKEDEDVILPCSFKKSLINSRFDWKKHETDVFLFEMGDVSLSSQAEEFKDRVSHFPNQLYSGNASITIKKAKVSDSGTYTCLNIDSRESCIINLAVDCILKDRSNDPERKCGTCPKPTVVSKKVNGGVQVKCVVRGAYPEPTVELKNSDNVNIQAEAPKISRNGDYFDVILQAVVTKEDDYHCVVKQEEICHQIYSEDAFIAPPGITKISCKEDEDVILPCSFKENLINSRFEWKKDETDVFLCEMGDVSPSTQAKQFKHRVSHFPDQLHSGNASITIKKAEVSDSGTYTCLNIDSRKSYIINLAVDEPEGVSITTIALVSAVVVLAAVLAVVLICNCRKKRSGYDQPSTSTNSVGP